MQNNATATVTEIGSPGISTLEQVTKSSYHDEAKEVGHWERFYTTEGVHPFDEIEWKYVDARIIDSGGNIKFEYKNVEVPSWWNQTTINVVVDKYFRIINGVRETSVKQIFTRVASVIRLWAEEQDYFNSTDDANVYEHELIYALLHQKGAFNSPVWFNLGVPGRSQVASACFISGVEDTLESIIDFSRSEKIIFAGGSGSGANMSKIRSSYERLSSGSHVCGPIGWMEELDKGAKVMKSGGSTRNAAKMVVLDMDHPDILETYDGGPGFIRCKAVAEKIAQDLIGLGYNSNYNDPDSVYKLVGFQNANLSVSIPDSFMQSVKDDGDWDTYERVTGNICKTYKARSLWHEIVKSAWFCGDPGIQFTDTINKWHTTPDAGRINASNPCSEFLNIDNTACNLAAVNLTKFFKGSKFNILDFEQSIRIFVTAQNAIVAKAEYPTDLIRDNSLTLRPIGLNYGNLGSLLMRLGYSYDSDRGRAIAARLSSILTGTAYLVSSKLANRIGPFASFNKNKNAMIDIMKMHSKENDDILTKWSQKSDPLGKDTMVRSKEIWDEVIRSGSKSGFTISQATLQAPLGTISFLMGMDSTGIEPFFALMSYKSMVGGGFEKLINESVLESLINLGYPNNVADNIYSYMLKNGSIEGAPDLIDSHLPIFDCAMPSGPSNRYLSPTAHLLMMSAIQPLISCGISKTVNMPNTVTIEEIQDTYSKAWDLGLKCVALYRDGCKKSQPLTTKKKDENQYKTPRRRLPENRFGITHQFDISGNKGYITTNTFDDGTLGEVYLRLGKSGSTIEGIINGFTKLLSTSIQYGVPIDKLIRSFINTKFEPNGFTKNNKIKTTSSILDYLFKHIDIMYCNGENSGLNVETKRDDVPDQSFSIDAPSCSNCGSLTYRNGSCYLCRNCGTSGGCS